ncbi:MAG: phosphatase PAP2 family protein [Acidobacteriota bacterium]|nr:phosphatase PAP2 family protein [Acidobacteriota bacterium]
MLTLIYQFDRTIVTFLNQFVGRSGLFDRAADAMVSTYLVSSMLLLACICYLWFRETSIRDTKDRPMILREFVGVCLAGPLSRAMQLLLKFHPRPFHDSSLHFRLPISVEPNEFNHWSSFPSDHAAVYFALAALIMFHSRRLGVLAWIVSALAVFPRVYLGYHWPSDIVAGAVVGVFCVWVCRKVIPDSAVTRTLKWEQTVPYAFYTIGFLLFYQVGTLFEEVRRLGSGLTQALGLHRA